AERARAPAERSRAIAEREGEARLADWIRVALLLLRDGGTLTLVHRADRLDALLAALLAGRAGEIVVFPLWPGPGKSAKRILVRARKGVETPLRLAPGLVLHGPDGRFTPQAEAVLRDGEALVP
ncbi:MAG TPA: methyltransferase, partial [Kiloniellales bacterium]|nr:methyltransferase [Kiloniellales bacterium]